MRNPRNNPARLARPCTRRAAVPLLCLLCAAASLQTHAADGVPAPAESATAAASELAQLLRLFGQRSHAEARFEQSQYLAALTRPLQSAGTLSYRAPDHLEQHIETPRSQLLVLDHGVLSMQLGRHRRSVPLADYPQLAPLLDSLRALFAGDLTTLQEHFELQLQGPLTQWQLRLTPRSAALHSQLREIRLRGERVQISEIELEQQDGDHSVMHIEPAP
ncbi:MAG TPA: outer membrane lipoprotein carrier protein LolA [Steroidobacteraceae bacterium]|jgi:outer membrane lipoprotein-sorting protein|nr:outer membrane lipoprotein carrier protein LolA [Steroidobacteraceae bacterium]